MKTWYLSKLENTNIYLLSFEASYDMCMTFLRYVTFYECPKFKGKSFEILDYMEWYVESRNKLVFDYQDYWAGFNLPGKVINDCINKGILDFNKYDEFMQEIVDQILDDRKYESYSTVHDYYLIGHQFKDQDILRHELAHAYYANNKQYKKEMDDLIKQFPVTTHMFYKLLEPDYNEKVWDDEVQAYLSTGLCNSDRDVLGCSSEYPIDKTCKLFSGVFEKYNKGKFYVLLSSDQCSI